MIGVTGIGSWPGGDEDVEAAQREVREVLLGVPEGLAGLPFLPELSRRGPGADMIGRSAALLVDLPVDLEPHGWRLAASAGLATARAESFWRQDLDLLAMTYLAYEGPLKIQVTGPWTLAASLWLPGGERVLDDPGATRDVAASLVEGGRAHVARVREIVPGARVVLQVDEPSLTQVLAGRVPSASGLRTLRAPDRAVVADVLREVVAAGRDAVAGEGKGDATRVVVHSCASRAPIGMLVASGADAVSLDARGLDGAGWEAVAEAVDSGVRLWAGGIDAASLLHRWTRIGLPVSSLLDVTLTPPCGSVGDPDPAGSLRRLVDEATRLTEAALAE